jgi:hypothetical protein
MQWIQCYCLKFGILKKFTTPYTPQQNVVSERKNITLLGATLAMLSCFLIQSFLGAKHN